VIAIEDGGSLPFNPTSNDTDPDGDPLTWTPVFGPLQGTIVQSGNQWRYFGNLNVNGADAMPYQVCDNGNPKLCAFSVVTFVISPVNDPPVAKNDSLITVPDNTTTPIPVLQNDSDLDGDPLNIKRVFSPSHGKTEIISNEIYYTPDKDYLGLDGFRYQICDSSNACSTANVYLNVVFVNDAPIAIDDSIKINDVQTSILADVLKNDYDVEGDTFTISSVTAGTLARATIIEKDGKQYLQIEKISKTDCGMDLLTYAICGSGGCSTANVKVKVVCPFGGNLPQGFSPNGDGVNDKWVISNLDDFQPVQLIVYNRWGHPVFESQEYLNDWDGKAQSINQPLPDGTYFYTIRLNDDRKYNNFLEIRR
jgi:gliding motility-associated-like protein